MTFVKQQSVVCIFVFTAAYFTLGNASTAESDNLALHVENRHDKPAGKRIEETVVGVHKHACTYAIVKFETTLGKVCRKGLIAAVSFAPGGVADAEFAHCFVGEAALVHVVKGFRAERGTQRLVVKHRRFATDFEIQVTPALLFGGFVGVVTVALGYRYACALGKKFHRFPPGHGLVLHKELYHVAAFAAAEALENLQVFAYYETCRLFAVKRTSGSEVGARPAQFEIGTYYVNNVIGCFYFVCKFQYVHGKPPL